MCVGNFAVWGQDRIWLWNYDGTFDAIALEYTPDEWVHLSLVHANGELKAPGIKYMSYVPHGLVMSWSDNGEPVAASGTAALTVTELTAPAVLGESAESRNAAGPPSAATAAP